jgi:hypothetical protein
MLCCSEPEQLYPENVHVYCLVAVSWFLGPEELWEDSCMDTHSMLSVLEVAVMLGLVA